MKEQINDRMYKQNKQNALSNQQKNIFYSNQPIKDQACCCVFAVNRNYKQIKQINFFNSLFEKQESKQTLLIYFIQPRKKRSLTHSRLYFEQMNQFQLKLKQNKNFKIRFHQQFYKNPTYFHSILFYLQVTNYLPIQLANYFNEKYINTEYQYTYQNSLAILLSQYSIRVAKDLQKYQQQIFFKIYSNRKVNQYTQNKQIGRYTDAQQA
ncbi:hypothetical protein ABPG74_010298 [Tetrahymena malaccensis]